MEIEDDPKIFQFFLNFANTGHIVDGLKELDVEYVVKKGMEEDGEWPIELHDESIEDECNVSFNDLVEIYAFADRRDVPALSDHVVSVMLEKIAAEGKMPVEMLERLLNKTVAGKDSLMFQMLVETAARFVCSKDFESYMDDVPKEFIVAVLGRQREIVLNDRLTAQADQNKSPRAPAYSNADIPRYAGFDSPFSGSPAPFQGAFPSFSSCNFSPYYGSGVYPPPSAPLHPPQPLAQRLPHPSRAAQHSSPFAPPVRTPQQGQPPFFPSGPPPPPRPSRGPGSFATPAAQPTPPPWGSASIAERLGRARQFRERMAMHDNLDAAAFLGALRAGGPFAGAELVERNGEEEGKGKVVLRACMWHLH